MSKIGRNDICPCGSGKKYKKCCQGKEVIAQQTRPLAPKINQWIAVEDPLDRESNQIIDLIDEGRLDEAETAAKQLLKNYPEVIDGFERLGMVYEARGQNSLAADMFQKALDFTFEHDGFEEKGRDYYRDKIKKLRPGPRS